MEKGHKGPGLSVKRRQVAPFVTIANGAGQREIIGHGEAAVFFGDNVVDDMSGQGEFFRDETVFTT
jgi:hypothetical protein